MLVDASPLISFLKIERFDLLEALHHPILCTDFVAREVNRPRDAFTALLSAQRIVEIPTTDPVQLLEIERLYEQRGLGRGEASSIVLAEAKGCTLVLDDKNARKHALKRGIVLSSTAEIVVLNIQTGRLTLPEADSFIVKWHHLSEFPVLCKTFAELLV